MQLNVSEWIPESKCGEVFNLLRMDMFDVSGAKVGLFCLHFVAIVLIATYVYSTGAAAEF